MMILDRKAGDQAEAGGQARVHLELRCDKYAILP